MTYMELITPESETILPLFDNDRDSPQVSNHATIPRPVKGVLYIFIPNKSESDKTEYDENNGKIVSLSRVINSMYVIRIAFCYLIHLELR